MSNVNYSKNSKRKNKPFVYHSTVWKNVGGGLSNSGESKICKVGKHKLLLTRSVYLDRYGNPVHTAALINRDGTMGASYKSNGSATFIAEKALNRNGIDVKRRKK